MFFFKKKNIPPLDLSWLRTDMHSHLIPGIDDGAKDITSSLQLIKGFIELGYKKNYHHPAYPMGDLSEHIWYNQ